MTLCLEVCEAALKGVNSDYEAKRLRDIALRLPVVRSLPSGTFNAWLRARGRLAGQHKVLRLSNDRKYIEENLSLRS